MAGRTWDNASEKMHQAREAISADLDDQGFERTTGGFLGIGKSVNKDRQQELRKRLTNNWLKYCQEDIEALAEIHLKSFKQDVKLNFELPEDLFAYQIGFWDVLGAIFSAGISALVTAIVWPTYAAKKAELHAPDDVQAAIQNKTPELKKKMREAYQNMAATMEKAIRDFRDGSKSNDIDIKRIDECKKFAGESQKRIQEVQAVVHAKLDQLSNTWVAGEEDTLQVILDTSFAKPEWKPARK